MAKVKASESLIHSLFKKKPHKPESIAERYKPVDTNYPTTKNTSPHARIKQRTGTLTMKRR